MTIQVDITKKDLIQKLMMCDNLNTDKKILDRLTELLKQIESSGHYQEIYDDLHHIEKMLLE